MWNRDSLMHLPYKGTWAFLNNVRASGAKYLLVGSYIKVGWRIGWCVGRGRRRFAWSLRGTPGTLPDLRAPLR